MTIRLEPGCDALGIIDVQRAFMPGGSLPTPRGRAVIAPINRLLRRPFAFRFASQDWHPPGHISFASSHAGYEPMQVLEVDYGPLKLWPDHALQGRREADLHRRLNKASIDVIVRKGTRPDADGLSAFTDRGGRERSGLAAMLRERGIRRVFFAGLALDVCVAASAQDAAREGFAAYVIEDACRPTKPGAAAEARSRLERAGVGLLNERDLS